ncbi:25435_t:CDS:2 [Racocetra persica]|uniref:25435_t:CDS:1 n=1 Tax=Racocetra persica TaxID=160502 RepID=A0ACA9PYI3_9GLOM|nr:25435_t:CDS:2 [Racocetra persica]
MKKTNPNRNNNFSGSLKALENCKDLEYLCIGYQPNIKGGLEYLPAEKLTYFGCDGTEFKEIPELKAKHKEVAEKEKLIEELSKKIKESAKKLEKAKESEEDKTQKIARLESQIQILTKNKEKLATEIAKEKTDHQQTKPNHQSQLKDLTTILFPSNSCNSFANFAFADLKKQASQIIQENQEAQVKISELESQISNLNQQLYSIQQQTAISQGENLKTAMEKETNSNRLANENY